jgi:hypothetical protein
MGSSRSESLVVWFFLRVAMRLERDHVREVVESVEARSSRRLASSG